MPGTLRGGENVSWKNCRAHGQSTRCPTYNSGSSTFPVTISGTIDRDRGSGQGAFRVGEIRIPAEGDWNAKE